MNPEVEAIQAQLRQVDDYQRKGLLRAEEAESRRAALRRKLMNLVIPDMPAPPLPWRVRAWSVVAMLVLVGACTAYLLSGHAGLRTRSERVLDQGKLIAAQDAQARRERLERIRRGESLAPDRYGRFATSASVSTSASEAAVAPLLSGRVQLDPKFEGRVASDDSVFITVRTPDDPTGLPLAQMRVEVSNLPLDFDIGTRQMVGSTDRFLHADKVVVSALVSRSGRGLAKAGDLTGQSAAVAPWSADVRLTIDRVVR